MVPTLRLAFLDVGQGDATVIYDPISKEAVLVDCAHHLPVIEFLESEGIKHLRAVVITHAHQDHYAGFVQLLRYCDGHGIKWDCWVFRWSDKDYRIAPTLLRDLDGHSDLNEDPRINVSMMRSAYQAFYSHVRKNKKKKAEPPLKGAFVLDSLEFIHPSEQDIPDIQETHDLNNISLVIRVKCGAASALLTGDIGPEGWNLMRVNSAAKLKNAVLKFPHHGAWKQSELTQLIDDVDPSFIIISVGTANKYGHPNGHVLHEVSAHKRIRLLCTEATSQCGKGLGKAKSDILSLIRDDRPIDAAISKLSHGCPCAGTVIVELNSTAEVISPSIRRHVDQIIHGNFSSPKCEV